MDWQTPESKEGAKWKQEAGYMRKNEKLTFSDKYATLHTEFEL